MVTLGDGIERAFGEFIGGIIMIAMITAFESTGLLPWGYALLLKLVLFIGSVEIIHNAPYWGTAYLFGYFLAYLILLNSGLLGIWDLILGIGVPIAYLGIRFSNILDRSF